MENLFNDKEKIGIFKQIQTNLMKLNPDSEDDEINQLISEIPQNYLNEKDNLKIVCQLFSYYARNTYYRNRKNSVKLFEKIINPIKTHLQDESTFFWFIFGGLSFFKLWMYEEGLISIKRIINYSRLSNSSNQIIEYFLPEIIEKEPEIFEYEIKKKFEPFKYSKEYINEFKELRKKHFNWLRNSYDFNDPIYKEIEKDQLRYSIKTDNIELFQRIISNNNIDINSYIEESIIENSLISPKKISILNFALDYSPMKILKYLILNNVNITPSNIYASIYQNNYELIHLVEAALPEKFEEGVLGSAIYCWSDEMVEYSFNNYPKKFFIDENYNELDKKDEKELKDILSQIFYSYNFVFFDDFMLPFLRKHNEFVKKNIYKIIQKSFVNDSCFFLKEFLKYPEIDINFYKPPKNETLLLKAIKDKNENAVEVLLNEPNIDINLFVDQRFSPYEIICVNHFDLKIIKKFCNNQNFDVNMKDKLNYVYSIDLSIIKGNSYTVEYLFDNFPNIKKGSFKAHSRYCIQHNLYTCLKILVKYELKNQSKKDFLEKINSHFFLCEHKDVFEKIINELQ